MLSRMVKILKIISITKGNTSVGDEDVEFIASFKELESLKRLMLLQLMMKNLTPLKESLENFQVNVRPLFVKPKELYYFQVIMKILLLKFGTNQSSKH